MPFEDKEGCLNIYIEKGRDIYLSLTILKDLPERKRKNPFWEVFLSMLMFIGDMKNLYRQSYHVILSGHSPSPLAR